MVVYCGCELYVLNTFVIHGSVMLLCSEFLQYDFILWVFFLYDALWLFSIVVQNSCLLCL